MSRPVEPVAVVETAVAADTIVKKRIIKVKPKGNKGL
jgi:hypothetical protein